MPQVPPEIGKKIGNRWRQNNFVYPDHPLLSQFLWKCCVKPLTLSGIHVVLTSRFSLEFEEEDRRKCFYCPWWPRYFNRQRRGSQVTMVSGMQSTSTLHEEEEEGGVVVTASRERRGRVKYRQTGCVISA